MGAALVAVGFAALVGVALGRWRGPGHVAVWFAGLVLLLPSLRIGAGSARVEHLAVPVLVVLMIWRVSATALRLSAAAAGLAVWFTWGLAASVESPPAANATFVGAYSVLRPLLLIGLAALPWATHDVRRLGRAFVWCSIPVSVLAVAQAARYGPARALTERFYTSPGRAAYTLGVELEQAGFFSRPVAVFENVSYAGTFCLLVIGTAVWLLATARAAECATDCASGGRPQGRPERAVLWLALVAALVAGVLTISATFMAGVPCALLLGAAAAGRRSVLRVGVGIVAVGAGVAAAALPLLATIGAREAFDAQFARVATLALFANRYGAGEGVLAGAIEGIRARPVAGWGVLANDDVFYSDSLYVMLGYTTGLVGAALFLAVVVGVTLVAWRRRETRLVSVWGGVMLLAGVGAPTFFVPRLMDWWWLMGAAALGVARRAPHAASVPAGVALRPAAGGV